MDALNSGELSRGQKGPNYWRLSTCCRVYISAEMVTLGSQGEGTEQRYSDMDSGTLSSTATATSNVHTNPNLANTNQS